MPDPDDLDLRLLTTVPTNAEAVILVGDLDSVGIPAVQRSSSQLGRVYGSSGPVDVYVRAADLSPAREVLSAPVSEEGLLEAEERSEGG
jgi:hypothetical protein